jgi:SAM-dependent methyltransferase
MKWTIGAVNPNDPWTRFRSYKWLITRALARAVAAVGHHARGRVLDVGCGDKRLAQYCLAQADLYIGLDHPATFGGRPENVEVFGTALALPFPDGTFDTVVSFEVLEHVPDSRGMVAELQRVLKPGGRLILSTPFLWGEHCQPHDYFRFTVFGLRRLFEDAGLAVLEQRRVSGFWTVAGERFCYYLWPLYGRRLAWLHTLVSWWVLVCASLLEHLHPGDTDYTSSVVVGMKPAAAGGRP